jgi:hypothetical protein
VRNKATRRPPRTRAFRIEHRNVHRAVVVKPHAHAAIATRDQAHALARELSAKAIVVEAPPRR